MFVLDMLAANAIRQKTTIASFKSQRHRIIPKSFATESLLANIILGKYQYAMLLYHQESLFTQPRIELSRTTMARCIIQVSEKFEPLYVALKTHLLEQVVIHPPEPPLNVLKADKALAKIQKFYGIESCLKCESAEK